MLAIIAALLVAFVVALVQGTYVVQKNPRVQANQIFGVFSGIIALWFLGTAFQLSSVTEQGARMWFTIGTLGWFLIAPLFAHFTLALSENQFFRRHRWPALLLYAPAVAMTSINLAGGGGPYVFSRTVIGWTYASDFRSVWISLANAHALASVICGVVILTAWSRKSSDPRRKSQSRIIVFSVAAAMISYGAAAGLAYLPGLGFLPSIANAFATIWLAGMAFAILRYKLMSISTTDAALTIFTTMTDGVLLVSRDGVVANANPAARRILGASARALIGSRVEKTFPGALIDGSQQAPAAPAVKVRDLETIYEGDNGKTTYLSISVSNVLDQFGEPEGTVITFRDITGRKEAENQLHHMATHDVLTALPNRTLLNDRLKNALSRAQRAKDLLLAVLFIDLDKFKEVNDRYGHDSGDILLKEAARRLTKCVRDYDTVCRLGGDEFVIVLTDLKDQRSCEVVIERIRKSFATPVALANFELTITLSIGVSLYPLHSDKPEELFKFADIALYRVKSMGRNGFRFYTSDVDSSTKKSESLERGLAGALARNEFEVFYQPIYDLTTNRLASLEALLRWNHPGFGQVRPMDFIPIAERTGYIVPIGQWVLREACRQLGEWGKAGLEIPLAVNLSAKQFQDPDMVDMITRTMEEFGVAPRLIELEFTESTAMVNVDRTVDTVRKLMERGIRIVIDDFGSGFSSMAWLKHLHPKALKIDKFFIQNVVSDANDAAIVRAIVTMAHSMGMLVIAEGIESTEQLDAIRHMQWERTADFACDCVQGFLFSKPVPASEAVAFLQASSGLPADG
jgi:diguanylate cyclase (GGDEF)-like protein/PAS domain S-box-containing protein